MPTLPNGDHLTRYGNRYSAIEWREMQETWKAEADAATPYADQHSALTAELLRRLEALMPENKKGYNYLWNAIQKFQLDFELERGALKFSSPERAQAIRAIEAWYEGEAGKLFEAEQDAIALAQERVALKYDSEM